MLRAGLSCEIGLADESLETASLRRGASALALMARSVGRYGGGNEVVPPTKLRAQRREERPERSPGWGRERPKHPVLRCAAHPAWSAARGICFPRGRPNSWRKRSHGTL